MFHDFLLFSQFHGKAPQLMPRGCSIINSCTSLFLQQKRRRREHIKRRGELEEKKLQRNSELEEKDWYCLTYDDAEDDYMISAWILWTAGCAFAQENNRKQSRARKPGKKTAGHALNPYYRCSLHLLNEIAKKLLRVLQKSWHLMQLGSGSANVPPQLYNTLCGFTGNSLDRHSWHVVIIDRNCISQSVDLELLKRNSKAAARGLQVRSIIDTRLKYFLACGVNVHRLAFSINFERYICVLQDGRVSKMVLQVGFDGAENDADLGNSLNLQSRRVKVVLCMQRALDRRRSSPSRPK